MLYIPYILFMTSLVLCWFSRKMAMAVFAGAILSGYLISEFQPGLFIVLSIALTFISGEYNKTVKTLAHSCFATLYFLLFIHKVSGINNLKFFDAVYVGEHCRPFTMYLNMENGLIAGVLLCGFLNMWFFRRSKERGCKHAFDSTNAIPLARTCAEWKQVFVSAGIYGGLCIATLMGTAIAVGHVAFNPKFPPQTGMFLLNNLMLVCMAEEVFFRGYIQKNLIEICGRHQVSKILALVAASIMFGLRHYQSGLPMIILSTIAGLFYGAAYMRNNRIESAILVHFALNAVHFFFFSYPSFVR